jgi:exonuclease III
LPWTQILDNTTRKRPELQEYRIGTWNIRSLYKSGAPKSISDAVKKYKNVQIVALQEVRWPGEGDVRVNEMTLFYSGTSNRKHENGVGFLVNDQLLPSIKKFIPENDRICHIRIAGEQYDTILICVYSPTETKQKN